MSRRAPTYEEVADALFRIESEMKRIGYWQAAPPPPEAFEFRMAFAIDTMAYEQWLQFVFIPNVKKILEVRGHFPRHSEVGGQAIREFDGDENAQQLVNLLIQFDSLFEPVPILGLTSSAPAISRRQVATIIVMCLWVVGCFLGTYWGGRWANRYLPRSMHWTALSERTVTGLEVMVNGVARVGMGRPGPVTIERLDVHLTLRDVSDSDDEAGTSSRTEDAISRLQRRARFPIHASHVLTETAGSTGETALADVTPGIVEGWLEAMVQRLERHQADAVLRETDRVYAVIERIRSAKASDAIATWPDARGKQALPMAAEPAPREYGKYVPDWVFMTIGTVVAVGGLWIFFRPRRGTDTV